MKKIFILISIITLSLGLTAQNTTSFEWAKSVSSSLNVDVRDIAVDSQGNSYITGGFWGTASFGTTTITSLGNESIFIAKLDESGDFIWATSAGSDGGDRGNGIALDAQGNSYITGYFRDGAIFGNTMLTNTTSFGPGIFIAKLDNSGNFIWAKSATGTSNIETYGNDIAIDSEGNSYIVGRSVGVSFGASPAITGIFTAKLDASGNDFEWAKQIGEYAQFIDGHDIALDSQGNPHITGRFEGTMSFGDTTLTSQSCGNFIAKLDVTGNYIWVRKIGDNNCFRRLAIALDDQDKSHVVGAYLGSTAFGDTILLNNGPYVNGFITKLDTSGQFIWARKMNGGSNHFVSVEAIAIDAQGNSYIAGEFSGSSLAGYTGLTAHGGDDVFIAKMDTLGVFEWVKSAGSNLSDELRGIAVDAQGNSYITGVYKNTATFGAFSLTSVGSEDAFIAKISEGALSSIENNEFQTVKIYPNPTNSFLFIESETPIEKLIIRDLSGKIVYQSSNSVEEKVDVQNLNSGIYLLEIMFENIRIIKKFVKD